MADTNIVLSGDYAKKGVYHFQHNGTDRVYVGTKDNLISQDTVSSIEVINNNAGSKAVEGAIWGGVAGAVVGSSIKDVIVKVTWKDGKESIMKVRSGMYDWMVVSAHAPSISKELIRSAENKAEKDTIKFYIALFIIAVVYIVVYAVLSS